MKLSQSVVDRLSPVEKSTTFWDLALPDFGIRLSPKGRRTWIAMYSVRGRAVMETIGTIAIIPKLADARDRARLSIDKARQGINPVAERRQEAIQAAAEATEIAFTFAKLADRYMREYAELNTKASTCHQTRRLLDRAATHFGDLPVRDIRKTHVVELISFRKPGQTGTTGLLELNNLLAVVRRCFRWAVSKDIVDTDPTTGVLKPLAKEPKRDRILTDDEIMSFWQGCDAISWPFGPVFKLLLLTAQRRSEVAGMRWSELDLENQVWHIPGERTKNSKAHDVHLCDFVLTIVRGLHHLRPLPGKPDFVFTITGRTAVSGFAFAKSRVDEITKTKAWRIHDLRRTATTGMARLGVPPHVADRVLNHTSGTITGVAAVYNRFAYIEERREALTAWGRFIEGLVSPNRTT
jgi:integrase